MDCPGAQRQKIADEIWGIMQADTSFKMDVSHYNTLLRVYLDNAKDFSPQDILTELASNDLAPNRVTYQHLIAKFCQVQGVREQSGFFNLALRERNIQVRLYLKVVLKS